MFQKVNKRILILGIGIIVICAGFVFGGLMIYKGLVSRRASTNQKSAGQTLNQDEVVPGSSDIRISNIKVSDNENSFFILEKAAQSMPCTREEQGRIRDIVRGAQVYDNNFIKEVIKKSSETLKIFDEITSYQKFQDPTCVDMESYWLGTTLVSRPEFVQLSFLSLANAQYLIFQNKDKEALDAIFKVLKTADLIKNSQGTLLLYLVGLAIQEEGLRFLRTASPGLNLSAEELVEHIKELEKYQDSKDGLILALKGEATMSLNDKHIAIDRTKRMSGDLAEKLIKDCSSMMELCYFYKPNKTERILVEHWRQQISRASEDFYKDMISFNKIMEELANSPEVVLPESKKDLLSTENIIGRTFLQTALISFPYAPLRRIESEFSARATEILLALKAYQQKNNNLPVALSQLVPEYLPSVPLDPFDGEPIRYNSQKRIIYSVGKELEDLGGSKGEEWQKMPNPTFEF